VFRFDPLAVEDSRHFGQRPKLEDYDDFIFLVAFGYSPDEDGLVEVHCFYAERYLVTVRRDDSPTIDELFRRYERRPAAARTSPAILYSLLDGLVDSFFPVLRRMEERAAVIEEEMLRSPDARQLDELYPLRRRLVSLSHVVNAQADVFGVLHGADEVPGVTDELRRAFRDVHDHLLRLGQQIEVQREVTRSIFELYSSRSSNQMTLVMKRLTTIATIFLPLSFVTGFFGQNFGWMVENVGGRAAFLGLGVGLQLVAIGILLLLFRRRGWS
jgi:magnesium transporter